MIDHRRPPPHGAPRLLGGCLTLAALLWPATKARAADQEIRLDTETMVFAGPLTYGDTLKIVTDLPTGSVATLVYWPRRRSETCTTAYDDIANVADSEFLVKRAGVPGESVAGKPTKYVFTVDHLLVGLPYCFRLDSTRYIPFSDAEKKRIVAAIAEAQTRVLENRHNLERYADRCSARDLLAAQGDRGVIKACMIGQEFAYADAALAKLQVQATKDDAAMSLQDLIVARVRDDQGIRDEFQAIISNIHDVELREPFWVTDAKGLSEGFQQLPPPAREAIRPLIASLAEPSANNYATFKAANDKHCTQPPNKDLVACKHLDSLVITLGKHAALAEAKKGVKFRALADELKVVKRASDGPIDGNIQEASFKDRIPFYVSLDVGGAIAPFRTGTWGIAQYFGVNFYFIPMNRDEPLRWRATRFKGREFVRRFSLSLGITTTGAAFRDEDGVTGAVGKQFLMFGGGIRLTNILRLGIGTMLYRQTSQNPAGGETKFRVAPFFGISMDIDVFTMIKKGISGS